MASMFVARAVLLAAVLYATSPLAAQAPRLRDSSGITIIENGSPGPASRPPFSVADRPTLQIGDKDGDPSLLFNNIAAVTRLSDGSIVVADRASAEIRIFDGAGRLVRKLGRKGDGPGEFRSLAHLWALPGDSLGAWDAALGRFTVFTPAGAVARTFQAQGLSPGTPGFVAPVRGFMGSGAFFGYRVARQAVPAQESIIRDTLVVGRYQGDGAYLSAVGRFLGIEIIEEAGGSMPGPTGARLPAFSRAGVPFARETILRTGSDWLYAGDGGTSYEIFCYDRSGQLRRIIRVDQPPRRVTPAMIAQHRAAPRGPDTPARPNVSPNVKAAFYPKTIPAFAAMLVDGAQRLWVREYPAPGEAQPRWNVFSQDGKLLGSVTTPAGVEVREIGTTYLLGVWRDELDVEYVRVYSVSPGPT